MSIPPDDLQRPLDFVETLAAHDASVEAQAALATAWKLMQMGWVHYNCQWRRQIVQDSGVKVYQSG